MHTTTAPAFSGREQSRFHASEAEFTALRARAYARAHPGCPVPQTEAEWAAAEAATQGAIDALRPRSERQQRALDAYVERRRTPNRRRLRPAPEPTRQYARNLAMDPVQDERLCSGAVRTLLQIRAAAGREGKRVITKAYLARKLRCSTRTVQRHISALREYDYISTEPVLAASGRQTGQRITVTHRARAFWDTQGLPPNALVERPSRKTPPSPLKSVPSKEASKERRGAAQPNQNGACRGSAARPERRPPSG